MQKVLNVVLKEAKDLNLMVSYSSVDFLCKTPANDSYPVGVSQMASSCCIHMHTMQPNGFKLPYSHASQ